MNNSLPLLGITGYSGSGKTTLLEKLLPQLIKKGLRVSVIKHSHHNAQVDQSHAQRLCHRYEQGGKDI